MSILDILKGQQQGPAQGPSALSDVEPMDMSELLPTDLDAAERTSKEDIQVPQWLQEFKPGTLPGPQQPAASTPGAKPPVSAIFNGVLPIGSSLFYRETFGQLTLRSATEGWEVTANPDAADQTSPWGLMTVKVPTGQALVIYEFTPVLLRSASGTPYQYQTVDPYAYCAWLYASIQFAGRAPDVAQNTTNINGSLSTPAERRTQATSVFNKNTFGDRPWALIGLSDDVLTATIRTKPRPPSGGSAPVQPTPLLGALGAEPSFWPTFLAGCRILGAWVPQPYLENLMKA